MKSPIKYERYTGTWSYSIGSSRARGFRSQVECGKAYAEVFLHKNPKYKPLVEGKPWPDVARILGIKIDETG